MKSLNLKCNQETSWMKLLGNFTRSILTAIYRELRSSKPDAHKQISMYAAKTLSRWSLDQPKPGSNSGYIVLKDEESEPESACCFGCPEETRIRNLPFPQDRILTIKYSPLKGENGSNKATVCFIPAVGHPLSSNRYYVIVAKGRKRG